MYAKVLKFAPVRKYKIDIFTGNQEKTTISYELLTTFYALLTFLRIANSFCTYCQFFLYVLLTNKRDFGSF